MNCRLVKYFVSILHLFFIMASAQAQVLNNNGAIGNITSGTVVSGGTFVNTSGTISNAGILTLSADLTNSATIDGNGIYNIAGDFTNNSVFTAGTSTVTFNGSAAQTLDGTAITTFNNIVQSNSAGVSLGQDANLVDELSVSSGTFTTTGFDFTLISDASRTARIAEIPAGADITGNIVTQRYSGIGPTDWRFLSSAVSGATIADWADDFPTTGFTGSTQPGLSFVSIYSYDESVAGVADNGYVPATSTADPIVSGLGYWVYLGDNPITFSVTGPPHTFTVTPTVTYSVSAGMADDGWNLIANPYPSAIDWDDASWTKTNVDDAVYIYNSNTGTFASYVGGVGVNGGSRYIASQQAFWVKANASSPAITMVEDIKADQDPSHLKLLSTENTSHYPMAFSDFPVPPNTNSIPNSILLTASGNGYSDETFIRFKPGSTGGFDGESDAWKLENPNAAAPNFSSVIMDSLDLSINNLPDLTYDIIIPIRLRVPVTGTYTISRDSSLLLTSNACVMLEDLVNNSMIDLFSNVSYSFIISDTTSAPRFLLHICDSAASTGVSEKKEESSGMKVIYDNGDIYLAFDLAEASDVNISVYNLLGAQVLTKNAHGVHKGRIKLDLDNISAGMYVAVAGLSLNLRC